MTTPWLAGVSKVCITPREPIWLDGWGGRTKPSQGVTMDIFSKSLALRDGAGRTAVLVTNDLMGISATLTESLATWAKQAHGLDRSQIMINVTHNHSAPVLDDVLPLYYDLPQREYEVIHRYTIELEELMRKSITAAMADLKPARLGWGQSLAGFAVNRRRARPGGRPLTTLTDPDVPVLTVRGEDGTLRGIVFGYACHTTCIEDGKVNGDWAGYAQHNLEQMHPGAVALCVAGCGADANPLPRFREGLGEAYGRILAYAVDEVVGGQAAPVEGPLRTGFKIAKVPFKQPPTREDLLAMLPGREGVRQREVEYQLAKLDRGEKLATECGYKVQVWQFGDDLKLIGLTGETVADYALRFKKTYGWENTWVAGYNNELIAYVPSLRVLREGGYEGTEGMMEYRHPGPFGSAIEEVIADAVDDLVRETSS